MHFQYPMLLALLLVVPPLVALAFALASARQNRMRDLYGDPRLLAGSGRRTSAAIRWLQAGAAALGSAALIVALARPSTDSGHVEFPRGTTDVIVLVDVSRSMAPLDYKGKMPKGAVFGNGTRLDMARHLIRESVVPALGANRLGIVTFAGEAFPLAPLTGDASAVDWIQRRAATINSAPGEGSALVKAFLVAFELFELDSDDTHNKVIILFSDGGNDDGLNELAAVTQALQERGIKLVVVGLGKTTPSPIPVAELTYRDQYAMRGSEFYMDNGEVATTALDENVLRLLANRSGGKYLRITDPSDFSFESLTQRLETTYKPGQQQLFTYPLLLALVLLAMAWFIGEEFTNGLEKVKGRKK